MRHVLYRKFTALALMIAVGSFQTVITGTAIAQTKLSPAPETQAVTGELSLTGEVTLNEIRAVAGDTVMNESVVRTECNGAAAINLGRLGRIELGAGSEMIMNLSERVIGGSLRSGSLVISSPAGVTVSIQTPEGLITTPGRDVSVFTVDLTSGRTRVSSQRSDVKVTFGDRVEFISAGQETAVGTQNPGQGTRCQRLGAVAAAGGISGGASVAGLSGPALALLIIAGIGGALAPIVVAAQSDAVASGSNRVVTSTFIP
jgi:hypothetical protein